MLSVDDYEKGDMIELSAIDSNKMDLVLFHGGYSLASANQRTLLENGKRYLIDGTQKLFLMANVNDRNSSRKPYFSLAVKKIPDKAVATSADLLSKIDDKTILSETISANPLTVKVDNVKVDDVKVDDVNLDTPPVALYTSKVQERTSQDE